MRTHAPIRSPHLALVAVAVTLALALVGCASGSTGQSASDAAADHNEADVTFATEMIPHHGQALLMVDMLRAHDVSPELQQLGDQIEQAQKSEIDLMAGWLRTWGEDVPDTDGRGMGMDHMHGDDSDEGAPGMMSDDDFADLDSAMGGDFEDMWLRMMIAHHEGAIEMAKSEQADGEYQPAIDLAGRIIESQTAEIDLMKQMLAAD